MSKEDLNLQLREAADEGDLVKVKSLIEQGADVHASDDYALLTATLYGDIEIVKYLISKGADVHADNDVVVRYSEQFHYPEIYEVFLGIILKEKRLKELAKV